MRNGQCTTLGGLPVEPHSIVVEVNGRRVTDDVVTIELRAIAGLLIPLVDKSFTPDAATSLIDDGSTATPTQGVFPYLNTPHDGYDVGVA